MPTYFFRARIKESEIKILGGSHVASSAYIKLVPQAAKVSVTTEELKDLIHYYKQITSKTGEQLDWSYESFAFPYQIKETLEGTGKWFYLHSNQDRYHLILIGVDEEEVVLDHGETRKQTFIQLTLPDASTHGDKSKANEFCKFLAKKYQAELHLFNGRVMYYNPRK